MKRFVLILIVICLCLGLPGCRPATREQYLFAMDTVMTFRIEGDNGSVFALCRQKVEELEQKFSATLPESELYQLNQAGTATLSADTAAVVEAGLMVSRETGQAFCLSLYPASRLWDFTGENPKVPAEEELEAVRPVIDDTLIQMNGKEVTLPQGGGLDLGGIAKGYTADLLAILMEEQQVEHYFLSLGGNVQVGGGNPDGSPWRIGIAEPDGGEYVGIIELSDGAVVTSGGYQRNFEQGGKRYHHILDRATLAPAESGLKSVTVVAESGTLADALSTALFVMGEEQALDYCRRQGDFECVLLTEDHRVVVSEGLKDRFTLHNKEYKYTEN